MDMDKDGRPPHHPLDNAVAKLGHQITFGKWLFKIVS